MRIPWLLRDEWSGGWIILAFVWHIMLSPFFLFLGGGPCFVTLLLLIMSSLCWLEHCHSITCLCPGSVTPRWPGELPVAGATEPLLRAREPSIGTSYPLGDWKETCTILFPKITLPGVYWPLTIYKALGVGLLQSLEERGSSLSVLFLWDSPGTQGFPVLL